MDDQDRRRRRGLIAFQIFIYGLLIDDVSHPIADVPHEGLVAVTDCHPRFRSRRWTTHETSEGTRAIQRRADKWLIAGTVVMGTLVLGVLGLPIFLRGLFLLRNAQREGLSVRPLMVTLIGYVSSWMQPEQHWMGAGLVRQPRARHAHGLHGVGQSDGRRLFLALQRAVDRRRKCAGRKGVGSGLRPHRVPDAHGRGHRIPPDEALGPPVADRHMLVRRGRVDRLHLQHDASTPTSVTPQSDFRYWAGGRSTSSTSRPFWRFPTCTRSIARSSPTNRAEKGRSCRAQRQHKRAIRPSRCR